MYETGAPAAPARWKLMLALVKCGGFSRLLPNQQRKKRLRPASVGAGGQADAGGCFSAPPAWPASF
ncbi:MAG: hypothetical protein DBX53_04320 [Clostridiales bacterium]|nr:MAG: hypothetical protein DBX53_04320 [Clostridiales bacterium]